MSEKRGRTQEYYAAQVDKLLQLHGKRYQFQRTQEESAHNWIYCAPVASAVNRDAGWKIHVSFQSNEISSMFGKVLPLLIQLGASFKIPESIDFLDSINSGKMGYTQIGKIITVYPASDRALRNFCTAINRVWSSSAGPVPPSDLQIKKDSPVTIRYGVFSSREYSYDEDGVPGYSLTVNGRQLVDKRLADGQQTPGITAPYKRNYQRPVLFEPDQVLEAGAESWLPFLLLAQKPFSHVYYGVRMADFEPVVLKFVPAKNYVDLHGLSVDGRLRNEYRILRFLQQRGYTASNRAYSLSRSDKGHFLSMEYLEGKTVAELDQEKQMTIFPRIVEAVQQLHQLGIIHRDLKLSNMLLVNDSIRLIDFEAACKPDEKIRVDLSTKNYYAHEFLTQEEGVETDIFALGTILEHICLQYDPAKLTDNHVKRIALLFTLGFAKIAAVVQLCHQFTPGNRISLATLNQYFSTIDFPASRQDAAVTMQRRPRIHRRKIFKMVYASSQTTHAYLVSNDRQFGWKNNHLAKEFLCEGINVGSAGIIIGLLCNGKVLGNTSLFRQDIEQACEHLIRRGASSSLPPGLFVGLGGMALALGATGYAYGKERYLTAAKDLLRKAVQQCTRTDLFTGAAGLVYAGAVLYDLTGDNDFLQLVEGPVKELAATYITIDKAYVWKQSSGDGPQPAEYLVGAAHGAAGIAMAIGLYGRVANNRLYKAMSMEVLERIYRHARYEEKDCLFYGVGAKYAGTADHIWCHGAAGWLWAILSIFQQDEFDPQMMDWAVQKLLQAGPVKDPTYCHGLSGQLELWRMAGRYTRYQELAERETGRIEQVLCALRSKEKGGLCWHSEDPAIITPDLWIGFLAPSTALALSTMPGNHDSILSLNWLKNAL
ncbi:MAG: hypothetical protein P0Y53_01070 [Candidatus Pseudobacter hemicellulosilyticus]|uniref:Protein kinase domain-containing protein n=1 Tax=Candidatus Pseudobacter hemicellulosilyticus TaxID=3121375 RepID=A0AAJ6BGD4_9BACT|nr:MAG: hypothetical protein P0Y53_01070 [Pseudobacter sp.]